MRRLRSALLPLAVGGLVLAAVPAAWGDDAPQRTGSFTALTYNVAGLPEGLSGSHPATNSPLISPLLDDYDLVLLQENWADPFEDEREAGLVGDEVPRLGYHDQVVGATHQPYRSEPAPAPPTPQFSPGRVGTGPALSADGLNRLSRFAFGPLERVMWDQCYGELSVTVVEEALKQSGLDDVLDGAGLGAVADAFDGGATDCAAQKGFSMARTELAPGVIVDVYNLHGEAGNNPPDQAASQADFAQLAEYVNTHSAGHAVILGGDTNLHSDRPDRVWEAETWSGFLDATGLHDVCEAVDCGSDGGAIDKFAYRSADGVLIVPQSHTFERERFTRDDGEPLSDHDPLAVTFRWVATSPG